MATNQQIARLQADWSNIAGEQVKVEEITGTFYGFASELGTLRLYRKYQGADNTTQGYSTNMSTFYFRLEPKI